MVETKKIKTLDWPVNSPDLNLMIWTKGFRRAIFVFRAAIKTEIHKLINHKKLKLINL